MNIMISKYILFQSRPFSSVPVRVLVRCNLFTIIEESYNRSIPTHLA